MQSIKAKARSVFKKLENALEEKQEDIKIDLIDDLYERNQTEEEIKRRTRDKKVINDGGDFDVQVHIQELRDLIGKDLSGASDPVVTVIINEQQKSTKTVPEQTSVALDQILFFSLKSLEPGQLSKTRCFIKVLDHNSIFPNRIIGQFNFNLGSIYYRKNHERYNQWVGLANNTELQQRDYEEDHIKKQEQKKHENDDSDSSDEESKQGMQTDGIQGSLKVSITVLGKNDEKYIHHEDEEEETDKMILLPQSIKQTPYKLSVKIYAYKHLAQLDKGTMAFIERVKHDLDYYNEKDRKLKITSSELVNFVRALLPDAFNHDTQQVQKEKSERQLDPFFVVDFATERKSSNDYDFGTFVGTKNDKVYIEFEIPVMEPTYCNNIQIEFWDKDSLVENDLISIIRVNYHRIKRKGTVKPQWYYMYGAPIGYDNNKIAKKMNRGFIKGTYFRGQSLIEISVSADKQKPPAGVHKFKTKPKIKTVDYELICDIYQGIEMYRVTEKEMFLEISVGRQSECVFQTNNDDSKDNDDDREIWNINKQLRLVITDLPADETERNDMTLPYIFIYICTGDKSEPDRIAYNRVSIKTIIDNKSNNAAKWYGKWCDMKEDPVLNKYPKNIFPGSVLCAFYMDQIIYDASTRQKIKAKQRSKVNDTSGPAKMIISNMAALHLPKTDGNKYTGWRRCDPCIDFTLERVDEKGEQLALKIEKTSVKKNTLDPTWNDRVDRIEFEDVNIGDKLYVSIKDDDTIWDKMPIFEEIAKITNDFIKLDRKEENQGVGDWIDLEIINEKYKNQGNFKNDPSVKFNIEYEYESKYDLNSADAANKSETRKRIEENKLKDLDKSKISQPKLMQLRADICLGKNLRTSDLTSLCDAFVQVRFCGKIQTTDFVMDRSDPEWFQTLYLDNIKVPFILDDKKPLKKAPSIYCEIYDKNLINKDIPIGRFEEIAGNVYLKKGNNFNEKKQPTLYDLKHPENSNPTDGEILAKFTLVSKDRKQVGLETKIIESENWLSRIKPPNTKPHSIHIIVLGLRDITSLLGVHECYIQFELRGKKYRSRKSNYPEPWNANYCEIIHFDVELPNGPENVMFLPNLNIYVIDSLFGGLIERNIGFASVPVKKLMHQYQSRIAQKQPQKPLFADQKSNVSSVSDSSDDDDFDDNEYSPDGIDVPLINKICIDINDSEPKTSKDKKQIKNKIEKPYEKGGHIYVDLPVDPETMTEKAKNIYRKLSKKVQKWKKSDANSKYHSKSHCSKYMKINDSMREEYDCALEEMVRKDGEENVAGNDIYNEEKVGGNDNDYRLRPFLDIPLFSADKYKRNIGNFKGLVSFAPKQSKLLIIEIYEAEDLWKPSLYGKIRPYVWIEFGGKKIKSKNIKAKRKDNNDGVKDDDWEMKVKFEIPIIEPIFADDILISVYDNNKWSTDDLIGYLMFSYGDIKTIQKHNNKIEEKWWNLEHDTGDKPEQGFGKLFLKISVKKKPDNYKVKQIKVKKIDSKLYETAKQSVNYTIKPSVKSQETEEEKQISEINGKANEKNSYDLSIETIREITKPRQLYLRLYVLNGINMISADGNDLNNPYLTCKLGKQIQTTKSTELFHKNTLHYGKRSPDFYHAFEFPIEMPGASTLKIECWDHDLLFDHQSIQLFGIKDNLIGITEIDIEDRWYDKWWRNDLKLKPIETRTVFLNNMYHGKLQLWMELLTVDEKKANPFMIDISQPAKEPYELRLIIWTCNDIPIHDEFTSMNDLYCKATFSDGSCTQQTDCHFRSEASWQCCRGDKPLTTNGLFNWRMKFPIASLSKFLSLPKEKQRINIQVWDQDYFSTNDYIGDVTIKLNEFLTFCQAFGTKTRCIWGKDEKNTIIKLPLTKKKADPNNNGEYIFVNVGTINITIELVPNKLIEQFPAGFGRDKPNKNPYLPDPTGRKELSLFHPCRSIRMVIGKRLYLKMCICLFCTFIIIIFVMMFPDLFSAFMADAIVG